MQTVTALASQMNVDTDTAFLLFYLIKVILKLVLSNFIAFY
jgi:hypothetical protein